MVNIQFINIVQNIICATFVKTINILILKKLIKTSCILVVTLLVSCAVPRAKRNVQPIDFTIAFGSCNRQNMENILWKEIKKNQPDLWISGGDNIYSNTDEMQKLKTDYEALKNQKGYVALTNNIPVMATWDDHDYGMNDAGVDFSKKTEAQKIFLDFFEVAKDNPRRAQKGIYHSEVFKTKKGSVKVIVLDTRYFRTALTESPKNKRRYVANTYGEGTVLGEAQWKWLASELINTTSHFNIIVSSIQILSAEHGFETWGNFPHEVDKLKKIILDSKAKGVVLLSGDRHISEFSKTKVTGLSFPLIDFTSSGLTHAYTDFKSEENKFRVENVISEISFGLLKFDFKAQKITMQMRGKNNKLLQELFQVYP